MLSDQLRLIVGAVAATGALASLVYMGWLSGRRIDLPGGMGDREVAERAAGNTTVLLVSGVGERALFWGFWVVALRILGPSGNGEYAFATSLFVYFAAAANFGLTTLVTREVARQPADLRSHFGNSLALRVVLLAICIPVLTLVATAYWVTGTISTTTFTVSCLIGLSLIPSSLNQAYAAIYAAYERASFRGATVVGTALLTVCAGLLALIAGWGLIALGAVAVLASAVTLVTLGRPLGFDLLKTVRSASTERARQMAGMGAPLMLNELLYSIFFQVDILVMQAMLGTEAVGKYNASYKFVSAMGVIPAAVVLPLFPALVRAAAGGATLGLWFGRAWRFLIMLALPITVGFAFLGDAIVGTFWGQAFLPEGGQALQVLMWFLPFSFLNAMLQYALVSMDRLRSIAIAFAVASVFNVSMNIALIGALGMLGAAYTTVASEIALLALYSVALRSRSILQAIPGPAARPLLGAAVMAGVLALAGGLHWVVAAALGALTYVAVLAATGGLTRSDLRLVSQAIRRAGV